MEQKRAGAYMVASVVSRMSHGHGGTNLVIKSAENVSTVLNEFDHVFTRVLFFLMFTFVKEI